MMKSKTEAKRKREKPETGTKAERCKWDPSYCVRVEKLGAEGKSAPEIRRELGISASAWRSCAGTAKVSRLARWWRTACSAPLH